MKPKDLGSEADDINVIWYVNVKDKIKYRHIAALKHVQTQKANRSTVGQKVRSASRTECQRQPADGY